MRAGAEAEAAMMAARAAGQDTSLIDEAIITLCWLSFHTERRKTP